MKPLRSNLPGRKSVHTANVPATYGLRRCLSPFKGVPRWLSFPCMNRQYVANIGRTSFSAAFIFCPSSQRYSLTLSAEPTGLKRIHTLMVSPFVHGVSSFVVWPGVCIVDFWACTWRLPLPRLEASPSTCYLCQTLLAWTPIESWCVWASSTMWVWPRLVVPRLLAFGLGAVRDFRPGRKWSVPQKGNCVLRGKIRTRILSGSVADALAPTKIAVFVNLPSHSWFVKRCTPFHPSVVFLYPSGCKERQARCIPTFFSLWFPVCIVRHFVTGKPCALSSGRGTSHQRQQEAFMLGEGRDMAVPDLLMSIPVRRWSIARKARQCVDKYDVWATIILTEIDLE